MCQSAFSGAIMYWSVLSVICVAVTYVRATDYCKFTPKHILCGNPTFGDSCDSVFIKDIKASEEDRRHIVHLFNTYRNRAAGGEINVIDGTLPQAANMEEWVWDNEMEAMAVGYAMTCINEHSCEDCRIVERFDAYPSGESLFYGDGNTLEEALTYPWENVLHAFTFNEEKFLYVEDTTNMKKLNKGGFSHLQFGHLTQAIWAETMYVGCARNIYMPKDSKTYNVFAVCSFLPTGNFLEKAAYKRGAPCSMCPDGRQCSTTYPNLCTAEGRPHEQVEVNIGIGNNQGTNYRDYGNKKYRNYIDMNKELSTDSNYNPEVTTNEEGSSSSWIDGHTFLLPLMVVSNLLL